MPLPLSAGTRIQLFKTQYAESFGDVEIWLRRMGGAPGGIKPRLGRALDAKEIYPPRILGIEMRCERLYR